MTLLAVSQKVVTTGTHRERWDVLDQAWTRFLSAAGLSCLPVPNDPITAENLLDRFRPQGVLLTGGNDLGAYGGDAPERDATEATLIRWSLERQIPVMGVCRGMQMLAVHCGGRLQEVGGHAGCIHEIQTSGTARKVNSFHRWAVTDAPGFVISARAGDVVEAIQHPNRPMAGQMWHPERVVGFDPLDLARFRAFFGGTP